MCDRNANIPRVAREASGEANACCGGVSRRGRPGRARGLRQQQASLLSDRSNLDSSEGPDQPYCDGISGLKTQLQTIQSDATKLVSSANNDFPSQTSAIKSSVAALQSAVKALPSHPSATQLGPVATAAASVVSSLEFHGCH